ncbi:MAG: hypothetical protein ACKPKO_36655, partial [Candidatus Fonsibacter sp.]
FHPMEILWVGSLDVGYVQHLVASRVHEGQLPFKQALQQAGILQKLEEVATSIRAESARKVLATLEASEKDTEAHTDVLKLRRLQAQQAALVLAEGQPADSSATVQASSSKDPPEKRPRRSK